MHHTALGSLSPVFELEFTMDHTFIVGAKRYGVEEYCYRFTDRGGREHANYCTVIHFGTPPEMAATDFLWPGSPTFAQFGNVAITQQSINYIGRGWVALVVIGTLIAVFLGIGIALRRPFFNTLRRLVGWR